MTFGSKRRRPRRRGPTLRAKASFLAFGVVVTLGQIASAAITLPIVERAPLGSAEVKRSFVLDEFGITHPDGMALISSTVAVFTQRASDRTILAGVTTAEDPVGTMILPRLQDPITTAFDPSHERLALLDRADVITLDTDHLWRKGASIERRSLKMARIADPRGAAFLPDGDLAVLDAQRREIVVVDQESAAVRRRISVAHLGARLRGLTRGPTDELLTIVALDRRVIYTIDGIGMIRAAYDLGDAGIRDVRAIAIGPSADPTDAVDALSLFATADTGRTGTDELVEFRLRTSRNGSEPRPAEVAEVASLIQTIDLSSLSPSSPDPSGIAYVRSSDDFVLADGEVDEMSIYRDVNLFRIDRTTRALVETGTTASPNPIAFSDEPVGAAFDPATATLILSDDDEDDVSLVKAGTDGRYGTSDDAVSEFDVLSLAGSVDAEGVAFDTHTGHIFIADGLGSEVYHLDPGSDGTFATADDVTSHWDMSVYGTHDPEGIAYNGANRTLLVLDKKGIVYEVDGTGALLRTIDCSAADALEPAGLELAPSSTDPSVMSLWIVDRRVDNRSDSSENDGRLFEMSLRATGPPAGRPTVRITAPENGSSHGLGASISFAGAAADARDGSLSSSLEWTSSRDGSIGTGASFTQVLSEGIHTITASVTDSDGEPGRASITVTIQDQPPRITIGSPSSGAWFPSGGVISFDGSATDAEDGTVTSSLAWTSSIDGAIGTGGSFSTNLRDGFHTITASVTDRRGGTGSASIKIGVGVPRRASVTLATGSDDAEEVVSSGAVDLTSGDLDLGVDGSTPQLVGLRFRVALPPGARVTRAYLQFRADEVSTGATSLSIWGQAIDNAPAFRRAPRDIGSRAFTTAAVPWVPPSWPKVDAAGPDQRTPNIAPILQEILARAGWASGNAVVLVITGPGRRTADSFEGSAGDAPVLHIDYR